MSGAASEGAAGDIYFSDRDAVLLTDETEFEFLARNTNASFERCRIFPLSMQAFGAALRGGHGRVESYFDLVDFADCKRKYEGEARRQAREWLADLGLRFAVAGIELARLDGPNQFLLFLLAWYLESTLERLIAAHPGIETFYLVSDESPLALDFYFDSSVAATLLRFICEQRGRKVRLIERKQRIYLFPPYAKRPITNTDIRDSTEMAVGKAAQGRRAGFVPVTVTGCQQILDALHGLGYHATLFGSTWGMPLLFRDLMDTEYRLGDQPTAASREWATKLADLWSQIQKRWDRSKLPRSIARNPHVQYQMEYIVTRRWLSYANMIERASAFATDTPLDVFIHADTFTAEGAILASVYRQRGTQIVLAPHSGWPVDSNWTAREKSDIGLTYYGSAARRLREISGMKVLVTGGVQASTYKSVLGKTIDNDDALSEKRRGLNGRKLVVFVTNALELLGTPFVDLGTHFETLSRLADTPHHLKDKILLAIRAKPRPLGEDPVLYSRLCGFSDESVTFLNGLTFSDSVRLADCVVGVNIPTTGYFEVLERGVPLLHVQTAQSVALHPDLPPEVMGQVTTNEAIWPVLEAILFDPAERRRVLEEQRRFTSGDGRPDATGDNPVQEVLQRAVEKRRLLPWGRVKKMAPPEASACFLGEVRVNQTAGAGYLDDLLAGSDGTMAVRGWAADMALRRPARAVHVYVNGTCKASAPVNDSRPDVAAALADMNFDKTGFSVRVPGCDRAALKQMKIYAELGDGTVYELAMPLASL